VGRSIDIPIEELPLIDEHCAVVSASPDAVWPAAVSVLAGSFSGRASTRVAGALGCAETERRGDPATIGSTLPGFVVARSVEPAAIALLGEHRFSRYALVVTIAERAKGRSLVCAETRAVFPGITGSVYRALVIGTRGHVALVKRLLTAIRRRAEGAGRGA